MAAKRKAVTAPPAGQGRRGPKPREVPFTVTTIRLEADQWRWLREEALRRTETGGKADASAVVRDLVARAMRGR